jgi:hypothetical protein
MKAVSATIAKISNKRLNVLGNGGIKLAINIQAKNELKTERRYRQNLLNLDACCVPVTVSG